MKQRSLQQLACGTSIFCTGLKFLSKQMTLQLLHSVFSKKLPFFFFSDFNLSKDVFLAIPKTSHACKALHIIHDRHDPQYSRHKGFGKKYPEKLAPSNDVRCSLYKILFKPFSLNQTKKNHIKSVSCVNGSANGCCVFRLT